eukprot:TRINITY_DN35399_c0_g1_i3.p1 TRINITY_DN35399_c0_g1~~TRINITY_DN35399_c0_g1_i3.p1  ORF type:complete len:365 (+),score=67.84 TRINITY_DN35399_c0_g1_i3:96-1190(+)
MEDKVLNEFLQQFPHLDATITELKSAYTNRLYHQLSELLLKIIKDNVVLQKGQVLVILYENFVQKIEKSIDQLKLVKFASVTADYIQNTDDQIKFIEKLQKSIESQLQFTEEQAILICQLKKGEYLLKQNKWEESEQIINQVKTQISKLDFVDSLLHSSLYKLCYQFHKYKENYDEFYMNGLQFLAYTNNEDIPEKMKLDLSLEMAIAILISPKIYNFSELLQQPVLSQLNTQKEYKWLYELLEIFNSGNSQQYAQLKFNNQIKFKNFELLYKNMNQLDEKIKIMSLLDLVFSLPKNERTITVSYTHLTLPTICSVQISVVAVSLNKKKKTNQSPHRVPPQTNRQPTQRKLTPTNIAHHQTRSA